MSRSYKFILLLFILGIMLPLNVFAKEKVVIKTDKEFLEVGDEVEVSAHILSDKKLYAMSASLNYDEKVVLEDNENGTSSVRATGDAMALGEYCLVTNEEFNIDNAKKLSNDRIKTYWLDSYKQVLSISNMLEKNLKK